jgi:hypothetical protein
LSIPELERMVGIDLLPSLTAAQKGRMLRLPKVRPGRRTSVAWRPDEAKEN